MGGGHSKEKAAPESRAVKCLLKFLRKGTMHLEITSEDMLAYEKLRQQLYEMDNPLKISVFDLALFISMSMECQKLLTLHTRARETDGKARELASKDFRVQVLKSNYRFIGGLSGFSQLCTFAVLTNVQYMLNLLDPRTQVNNKILFAPNAVFMKDKLEEAASGTEKRRQMLEEQNMPQIRKRAQGYTHSAGNNIKPDSLESGMCDHYHKWLAYARTFRASMELPPTGDMLAAAVGLLMEFEGK